MMVLQNQSGIYFENKCFEIFFGNKEFSPLIETSEDSHLCRLEQIHGADFVLARPHTQQKADGHWTHTPGDLLLIKTADCLPILLINPETKTGAALHAGWRGVEKKITTVALSALQWAGSSKCQFYIGPHIQQKSFEVDEDVAKALCVSHHLDWLQAQSQRIVIVKDKKWLVNLSELVIREIESFGFLRDQIWTSSVDTKTDLSFYSYRRGDKGVRNYSALRIKSELDH